MAADLRDPHTPRDVSCPGIALAAWGILVQQESNQMVCAHLMLHMTMLNAAMQV